MSAHRVPIAVLLLCVACGTPTPDANASNEDDRDTGNVADGGNNVGTDAPATNMATNGGGPECDDIDERFIEAVRGMARTCVTSDDCKIVERAQVCDCDLAVAASSDTAAYDAVRAEADTAGCDNPFGCGMNECSYFNSVAEDGEVVAHCNDEGMCEAVQVLSCEDYVAGAHGGLVPPGTCEDESDCSLREDLNPCGCAEAISSNFPLLVALDIAEMIEINDARCSYQCMGCSSPTEAICGPGGSGYDVCQAM